MSLRAHRSSAPAAVACAVLTVSDTRTRDTDSGGQAVIDALQTAGHTVVNRDLVRDEPALVRDAVSVWLARPDVDAIITTGGTGLARRDSTFDALGGLFERTIPGFGELFRALSYDEIGSAAMLSRAAAGVVGNRVVFLLPGSESAVRLAMTKLVVPELAHIVGELRK